MKRNRKNLITTDGLFGQVTTKPNKRGLPPKRGAVKKAHIRGAGIPKASQVRKQGSQQFMTLGGITRDSAGRLRRNGKMIKQSVKPFTATRQRIEL